MHVISVCYAYPPLSGDNPFLILISSYTVQGLDLDKHFLPAKEKKNVWLEDYELSENFDPKK